LMSTLRSMCIAMVYLRDLLFSIAARMLGGTGREPHTRACSSCQRTRFPNVAFLGIRLFACQCLFISAHPRFICVNCVGSPLRQRPRHYQTP
jgi:hypothetical protein